MTTPEILEQIKSLGSESIKKVLLKHGAKEPFYGTKIEDLKVIQKKLKKNYPLSLELYDTGISEAMYLAGLIADEKKMTKQDLNHWVEKAFWSMLSEYTVPWIAAESNYGMELALEWIDSPKETIASSGWATLSSIMSIKPDSELDINLLKSLLKRVSEEIHNAPNRVRYTMNGFIIAAGCFVPELTDEAIKTAQKTGTVMVDMSGTSCKVPSVVDYINKVKARGTIGKKKKEARC